MPYEFDEFGYPILGAPEQTGYKFDDQGYPILGPDPAEEERLRKEEEERLRRSGLTDVINEGSAANSSSGDRASAEYAARELAKFDTEASAGAGLSSADVRPPDDVLRSVDHEKLMASDRYRAAFGAALPVLGEEDAKSYAKDRIAEDAKRVPFIRDGIFADLMAMPKETAFDYHYGAESGDTPENPSGGNLSAQEMRDIVKKSQPPIQDMGDFGGGFGPTLGMVAGSPGFEHEIEQTPEGFAKALPRTLAAGEAILVSFAADMADLALRMTGSGIVSEEMRTDKSAGAKASEQLLAPVYAQAEGVQQQVGEEREAAKKSGESTSISRLGESLVQTAYDMTKYAVVPELKGAKMASAAVQALPASYSAAKDRYKELVAGGLDWQTALGDAGLTFVVSEAAAAATMGIGGGIGRQAAAGAVVMPATAEAQRQVEKTFLPEKFQSEFNWESMIHSAFIGAALPVAMAGPAVAKNKILTSRVETSMNLARELEPGKINATMGRIAYVKDTVENGEKSPLWAFAELNHIDTKGDVRDPDHFKEWMIRKSEEIHAKLDAEAGIVPAKPADTWGKPAEQVLQPTDAETATPEAQATLEAAQKLVGVPSVMPGDETAISVNPLDYAHEAPPAQEELPGADLSKPERLAGAEQQAADFRARQNAPPEPPKPQGAGLWPGEFDARVAQAQEKIGQPFVEEAPPAPPPEAPKRAGQVTPEMAAEAATRADTEQAWAQAEAARQAEQAGHAATEEEGHQALGETNALAEAARLDAERAAAAKGHGPPAAESEFARKLREAGVKKTEEETAPMLSEAAVEEEPKLAEGGARTKTEIDNGIPEGLPTHETAASVALNHATNEHWVTGDGKKTDFVEVKRDSLPADTSEIVHLTEIFTGSRIAIVTERSGVRGEVGPKFDGVTMGKGVLYLHAKSTRPIVHVLGHEWVHELKQSKVHLYNQLEKEVKRQGRVEAFKSTLSEYSKPHALEELTANATGDAMGDHTFVRRLAEENPRVFAKIAKDYGNYLDRFIGSNRDFKSNRYMKQVEEFREVLGEVLHQHAKERFGLDTPREIAARRAPGPANQAEREAAAPAVDPQTKTKEFKQFIGKSQVTKTGKPGGEALPVYHGTLGDVQAFDRNLANPEGDWGAGFYTSNKPSDIEANYAGEHGPDYAHKLEELADRIQQSSDEEMTDEQAKEQARAELQTAHQGMTMKLYSRMEEPLKIGGENETRWDEEDLENFRDGLIAVRDEGEHVDFDPELAFDRMMDLHEPGDTAREFLDSLKRSDFMYASDQQGRYSTNEVLRQALEHMGYDGIIDAYVNKKFGSERGRAGKAMEGMTPDTVHYINFHRGDLKSATGNRGTWDRTNPDITMSEAAGEGVKPGFTKDAIDLIYGDESFPSNKMSKFDAAKFLEERTREANGGRILELSNPEHRMEMARTIADEAMAAIEQAGNAFEWYDATIDYTMKMLVVKHPEIAHDADARTAFTIALAVTSQNMNVFDNLAFADKVYSHFKQHKEFPIIGSGEKLESMKDNFEKVNRLRKSLTMSEIRDFFEKKTTAGELKKLGYEVSGELVDTVVYGSAILGPKIGNGFWSNLNGNFTPVTMDMWFMRTMGRLRGAILNSTVNPGRLAKNIKDFKAAVSSDADRLNLQKIGIDKSKLTDDDDLVAAAFALYSAHNRDYTANGKKYVSKANPNGEYSKSREVLAAGRIVLNTKGVNDAPSTGTERNLLRDVVAKTLEELKGRGFEMKPAALQALIWYPEQALYAKLGVQLRVHGEDYASATFQHLVNEGHDPAELERAAGFEPGTSRFARSAADRRAEGGAGREDDRVHPAAAEGNAPRLSEPAGEENVAPHSDETGDGEPVKSLKTPVGTIHVETAAGQTRSGPGWSREMKHDYGFIEGIPGRDGGSMDAIIGEGARNPMRPVFVVHQKKADGSFDEHKVLVGFKNRADAVRAYKSEYPKGWDRMGEVEQFSSAEFKNWAKTAGSEQAQLGKVDPAVPRFQVRPLQADAVAMHATTSNPMPVRADHEGTPIDRLDLPNSTRSIQARTHFDDAGTVTKAHQVVLRNLYDVNTDPRDLFTQAVRTVQAKGLPLDEGHVANELENHIVAAGFDGYRSTDGKGVILGGKVKTEKVNAESKGEPLAASRPVAEAEPAGVVTEAPAEAAGPEVGRTATSPREDHARDREGEGDEGTAQGTVESTGERVADGAQGKAAAEGVDPLTAMRDKAIAEVMKKRGAEPYESVRGKSVNEIEAEAQARLEADPGAARAISREVSKKGRNLSDVESAMLAIDRQRIEHEHYGALETMVRWRDKGDIHEAALAEAKMRLLEDMRDENELASKKAGSEWSSSGRARMLAVKQDESLVSLLTKYKAAGDGTISKEARAELEAQAAEIVRLKRIIESPGLKQRPEMVVANAQKKFTDAIAELKAMKKDEMMTKECYI